MEGIEIVVDEKHLFLTVKGRINLDNEKEI